MKQGFRASLFVATGMSALLAPCAAVSAQQSAAPAPDQNAADAVGVSASNSAASDPGGDATNEIIVTAQKREQRLSDVPLSITAASGVQLAKQGITNAADLEKIVPGFTYRLSQYGTPVFSIRGIGFYDNQIAVSPAVTVYLDQVPVPYARMAEGASLDVERVEVLKGPQGTLFGQNSTGGAVNYIPAKPTDHFTAGLDATYGRFNEWDLGGFVSGPITDTLTARLSLRSEQRGAWQEDTTRDDSIGKRNFLVGRLLVDWRPTDKLKIELNANGWRNKSDMQIVQARGYLPVAPGTPTTPVTIATATALSQYPYVTSDSNRAADWDQGTDFARNDRFYQVAGRIDYELGDWAKLTSITAYSHLKTFSPIDEDGTYVAAGLIMQYGRIKSVTQEVRLEGQGQSRVNWVVGADYEHDNTQDYQTVRLTGSNSELGGVHFDGLDLLNNQKVRDLAGFGNLEFKITDRLSLQGAVRYTNETRDFSGCMLDSGGPDGFRNVLSFLNVAPGQCLTIGPNGQAGLFTSSLDQSNVSWKGGVNWKVARGTLLYTNVTKGYKSGTFGTLPAVSYLQYKPVTQESVVAYEVGFKNSLFDHHLDLDGAVFYYDYRNKQIAGFLLVPPFGNLPNLINVPKSRLTGAEFNVTARPFSGLRVTAGVTYISSRVLGSAITSSPFGNAVDIKGEAFPATPKWQLQGDAEYDFPLRTGLTAYFGGDVSYRSHTDAAFGSDSGPAGTQDDFQIKGYALLDLRAGVEINDKYRVQIWGKNVTGTQYWNNVVHVYDTYDRITGFPTTYGVSLSARF